MLATARTLLGRPIDVIGMDACLMAMAEVGYQVAPSASVFVGSQESEPGDGWPYDRILAALDANPAMDAAALGKEIVADYVASYPASEPVTQSAVTLAALTEVRKQAGVLGLAPGESATAKVLCSIGRRMLASPWARAEPMLRAPPRR